MERAAERSGSPMDCGRALGCRRREEIEEGRSEPEPLPCPIPSHRTVLSVSRSESFGAGRAEGEVGGRTVTGC